MDPGELPTRLSEARLRALAATLLDAARGAGIGLAVTWIDRAEPEYAYVDEVVAKLLGYDVDDFARLTLPNLIAPEEVARHVERRARRLRGEPVEHLIDTVLVAKDGSRVPVQVSSSSVTFEGRPAVVSFTVDTRARRSAEEALRRSELRFRDLVESAPEAIAISRDGRFLYVNPAFVKMFGFDSADEVLVILVAELAAASERATVRARLQAVIETGAPAPAIEYRASRRDGSTFLLEVQSSRIDYQGRPAVLHFGRDVTERRRMVAQLMHADRLAALGTLAASVAHEVNNPLAYVVLNLEGLERDLRMLARDPGLLPDVLLRVSQARRGAERVGAIVRQLRAFSRTDDEEARGPVDLRHAVDEAIEMTQGEMRHRARLVTRWEELPPVEANASRLSQVFVNLLVNAAQAIPEGHADGNEIRVVGRSERDRVIVEVSDSGAGMTAEVLDRVFDPFFTTKSSIGGGLGLGLSISQGIVNALGGRITARSAPGAGATFTVTLPAAPAITTAPPSHAPASVAPAAVQSRGRVLVVDDEPALGRTLCSLLQDEHDVVAVTTAREALELVSKDPEYDAVLCDLMMPDVSGVELYAEVKRRRPGLERRIVYMTGGAFTAGARQFLADIPNERLEKPFDLDAVRKILRNTVDARGAGRAA